MTTYAHSFLAAALFTAVLTWPLVTPAATSDAPGPSRLERACEAALDGVNRAVAAARRKRIEFETEHAEELAQLRAKAALKYTELRGRVRARWDRLVREAPPQVAEDLRRFARVWRDSTTGFIRFGDARVHAGTSSFLDVVRASFGRATKRPRANAEALLLAGLFGPKLDDDLARRMVNRVAPYLNESDAVLVIRIERPTLLFVAGRSFPKWFQTGDVVIVHDMLVHGTSAGHMP